MLSFWIIFSVYLATYTVNAGIGVLDNDGKPVLPSRLQKTQNVVGKNNVADILNEKENIENIQTTGRGLGTTTNWYENSMTDNFQNIPQQNIRAQNSNNNRRFSQSYGSPSSLQSTSSSLNDNWNNPWGDFQDAMVSLPSALSSNWNNFWDTIQQVITPPMLYPPPPQFNEFNYNTNFPFSRYNAYDSGNFGYSSGNNFQQDIKPPIPYTSSPPQFNEFNNTNFTSKGYQNNDSGNFGYDSGNNFQQVMKPPIPNTSSPPSLPQFNEFNYDTNFPFSEYNDYDSGNFGYDSGNNFQQVMNTPIPYTSSSPQFNEFNYDTNFPFSGYTDYDSGNFGYDSGIDLTNSPDIVINDDDIVVNGQPIPKDQDTQGAFIQINNNEMFINGQKVPSDAYNIGKTPGEWEIHGSNFGNINSGNINEDDMAIQRKYGCIIYKEFNFTNNGCYYDGSPNIGLYDGGVVINGKKIPMDIGSRDTPPVVKFNEKDGFTVNGKKVPADPKGNPLIPSDVEGSKKTADNFQQVMKPPIPYTSSPPPPQFNEFNNTNFTSKGYQNNDSGNFYYGNKIDLSNSPDIVINDDDIVVNSLPIPKDPGTQRSSILNNKYNEMFSIGQKVPVNTYNTGDWVKHGSNFVNTYSGTINEYDMAIQRQYGCILYKGFNFTDNGCYYDGSPNIGLYDGGVVINGKKIPMDIGSRDTPPVVKFNEKDGFTVNGKKVPADPKGNPLIPSDVEGSKM